MADLSHTSMTRIQQSAIKSTGGRSERRSLRAPPPQRVETGGDVAMSSPLSSPTATQAQDAREQTEDTEDIVLRDDEVRCSIF